MHIESGQATFRDFFNGLDEETTFHKPIRKNKTDFFWEEAATSSSDIKKQVLIDDCYLLS